MTSLKLISYKVSELNFINKFEKETRLSLQNSYSFNVAYTEDSTKCVAQMNVNVMDKQHEDAFGIKMILVGSFEVTDKSVPKEKLHVQAYNMLFPYARSIISTVSVNAGLLPIFLVDIDIEKQSIYKIDKNPPEDYN